jgi:hypothetical protein
MMLFRAMALLSALTLAGLTEAAAQFPPPPGQSAPANQSSPFPPPPGQQQQQQSSPFPPPGSGQQQQSSPFPSPGQSSAFPATGGSFSPGGPRPGPPPPGAQPPPVCLQFPPIREQAEKDGGAIKIASDRKATREEICALFTKFVGSESKMVQFLVTNQKICGVPPDAIKHVRGQHAKSQQIRKQVCSAGPAGGPSGPSLSDALGGPALPDEKPKPGRGTFDTLTGSPLAR